VQVIIQTPPVGGDRGSASDTTPDVEDKKLPTADELEEPNL